MSTSTSFKSVIAAYGFHDGWMKIIFFTILLGFFSLASAQNARDIEPNNSCQEAQHIGAVITLPFLIEGSLDTPPEFPDVDFFRFEAPAGTVLVADLAGQATHQGTLHDPFMGLFDSNCTLLKANDNYGSLNARLVFVVPADGIFILAATSCCDWGFSGQGGSSGAYQLIINQAPPAIGSVGGQLIDAITGEPLRGDAYPWASVTLSRCAEEDCSGFVEMVAGQQTDSAGQFRFELDFSGNPLEIGTYQIQSFAQDYEPNQTAPFDVGEGEHFDIGALYLQPPPIQFSEIRPCGNLPPEGGYCMYSVRVTNYSLTQLEGLAWSLVNSHGIGSRLGYTHFQAMGLGQMSLPLGQSGIAWFIFRVPAQVNDGAYICTEVFFGQGPDPFFEPLAQRSPLFCIQKGFLGGFNVLSEQESRKLLRTPSSGPLMLNRRQQGNMPKADQAGE